MPAPKSDGAKKTLGLRGCRPLARPLVTVKAKSFSHGRENTSWGRRLKSAADGVPWWPRETLLRKSAAAGSIHRSRISSRASPGTEHYGISQMEARAEGGFMAARASRRAEEVPECNVRADEKARAEDVASVVVHLK